MRHVLIDANVPLCAYGEPHPLRDRCFAIIEAATYGQIRLHASVEAMQEFVFHRMRRTDRATSTAQGRGLAQLTKLHPFDEPVWSRALSLIETAGARGRDAVHAATGLEHGFTEIVTADTGFVPVPGLKPVSPADVRL